jgi:hypothetical protein
VRIVELDLTLQAGALQVGLTLCLPKLASLSLLRRLTQVLTMPQALQRPLQLRSLSLSLLETTLAIDVEMGRLKGQKHVTSPLWETQQDVLLPA